MPATASPPASPPRPRLRRAGAWLTVAALGVLTAALLWHTTGDLDLLLHDRTGRDILAGEGVPEVNGYAFTAPDHPWVDHEWAFQVLVAAVGDLGDGDTVAGRDAGWRWLRLGLGLALLAALLVDLAGTRRPGEAARAGPVLMVALAMLWTRFTLRPELVSFVLLVLLLGRVEAALRDRSPGPRWRWSLDPRRPGGQAALIALLWYQIHGFAALAPLVWLLAGLLDRPPIARRERWRRAGLGALVALVAGVVTPNGLAGVFYPLQALGQFVGEGPDLQRTIGELVPLRETRGSLATTITVFEVSLVWSVAWIAATWPRRSRLRVALWLLALAAAWQGQRNLGFYAVAFALLHGGPTLATPDLRQRLASRLPERWRNRAGVVATLGAPLVVVAVAGIWLADLGTDRFYLREGVARRFGAGLTPANYPLTTADDLAARGVARVANTIDAASTLIWSRTGRVAIDGRTEAYPANAWRTYLAFRSGGEDSRRALRRWRADAVCLAHRNPASHAVLRTLLADDAWRLVAAGSAGVGFLPAAAAPAVDERRVLQAGARACRARLAEADGRAVRLADEAAAWAALLVLVGDVPVAEELLVAALAACPDHPVALHNLGNVLMAREDFQGALRRFRAAARLNRAAAPPLVNAGTCLFRLGRVDEAAAAFAGAVARDPRNFEGWANLAEARRRLGDREGAGAAYRRALELRPDDQRLRARARTL